MRWDDIFYKFIKIVPSPASQLDGQRKYPNNSGGVGIKYKNVTAEAVIIYWNLCELYQKKVLKKGLAVKSVVFDYMNDHIHMQSQPDRVYTFILIYQNHLTKFTQLRPLKCKRTVKIAYILLDIFTTSGTPSILQNDNGREFANRVVNTRNIPVTLMRESRWKY